VVVRANDVHQAAEEAAHERASPECRGTMLFHNPLTFLATPGRGMAGRRKSGRDGGDGRGGGGLAGWGVGDTPPHSPNPN